MERSDETRQRIELWDSVFVTAQWLAANGDQAWEHLHSLVDDVRKALARDLLQAHTTADGGLCLEELAELHRSFVLHNTILEDEWLPLDAWVRRQECMERREAPGA